MENDDKELYDSLEIEEETIDSPPQQATPAPETTAAPVKPNYKDWWASAETEASAEPEPEEQSEDDKPEPPAPSKSAGKLSKDVINASARTAVATLNMTQSTLLRPLMKWRFKKICQKRFGDNIERALDLADTATPEDEAEQRIQSKMRRLVNQFEKKLDELPFTDEEEKDMELAFKTYFEVKQVAMSPEVLLYCSLASILGKRVIDVAMWD